MNQDIDRIKVFLEERGWDKATTGSDEYQTYAKDGEFDIDINDDEIVFLDETGDFLHIPATYYGLIGVMVSYRMIPYNF
jgi:hypothetical protein